MNIEELQLITHTPTANVIINFFAHNKKTSSETILRFFKSQLLKAGHDINNDDFQRFFDEMQEINAGVHNTFNGQPNGRFVWKYVAYDLADQILHPNKMVSIRLVSDNVSLVTGHYHAHATDKPSITPVIESREPRRSLPIVSPIRQVEVPITIDPRAPIELSETIVFIYTTSKGRHIPFPLNEVSRLVEQAELVRSRIN